MVCKVSCWGFLAGNAPRSDRAVEIDGSQIETLIENNQCYTVQEIAEILKISKSSVENKQFLIAYMSLVIEDLFQRESNSEFDFYVEEVTTHPLGDERPGQHCLWCSHAAPRLHWLA